MSYNDSVKLIAYPSETSPSKLFFERKHQRTQHDAQSGESDLLKSIRAALHGSPDTPDTKIRKVQSPAADDGDGLDELAWDDHTLVWSTGGVIKSSWDFAQEGQRIQYAVLGWMVVEGNGSSDNLSAAGGSARYAAEKEEDAWMAHMQTTKGEREPFSPFFRARKERLKHERGESTHIVRTIFVFLRDIGRAFSMNGLEHTFSLPFVVRRAWAAMPYGVLLERAVEPAELTDPAPLPRLYTLTRPLREPRPVGRTEGIRGGYDGHRIELLPSELDGSRAPREIHAKEEVILMSDVLVTLDAKARRLSFWRWVYIPQKDAPPAPLAKKPIVTHGTAGQKTKERQAQIRMASLAGRDLVARDDRIREPTPEFDEPTQPVEFADMAAFVAVPGMPPPATAAALASLGSAGSGTIWPPSPDTRTRRASLNRNDLSSTMDRMMLGRKSQTELYEELQLAHRSILPDYWTEKIYEYELTNEEFDNRDSLSFGIFDQRFDGQIYRMLLGLCLPGSQRLEIFKLHFSPEDHTMKMTHMDWKTGVVSIASVRSTRIVQRDLLILKADSTLELLACDSRTIPIHIRLSSLGYGGMEKEDVPMDDLNFTGDVSMMSTTSAQLQSRILNVSSRTQSTVLLNLENGTAACLAMDLTSLDHLVHSIRFILSTYCKTEVYYQIMLRFYALWTERNKSGAPEVQFDCIAEAILGYYDIRWKSTEDTSLDEINSPWDALMNSSTHFHLRDDTALMNILPQSKPPPPLDRPPTLQPDDINSLHVILMGLHVFSEELRLSQRAYEALLRLSTLTLRLAQLIRPAFSDLLKRLFPSSADGWKSGIWVTPKGEIMLPPDVSSALYSRLAQPEHHSRLLETLANRPNQTFIQGKFEPHPKLREFTQFFTLLSDMNQSDSRKRSEMTVQAMVSCQYGLDYLNTLPLSISAPLREAARTCQLGPPRAWPVPAYEFVGRSDLTESGKVTEDLTFSDGYRTVKDHLKKGVPRKSYLMLLQESHRAVHHGDEAITGVEMEQNDYTEVRFGHDRRLQEVARMLCSSNIPSIQMTERPEMSDHEFTKEQQMQVLRTAERTLALPIGRAMFTFANVPTVTREVYTIPRIELSIRIQPQNTVIGPEQGKLHIDGLHWAEFHNGVAAALRISPASEAVDSSWITFNKPNELTPEHAGFLYGLGLTGHLKEMLTWHTFSYLTPKHDLTSIGLLLGLSAAHIGTQNRHVSKLLAVHTPAFLPSPDVDLNVPLATQSAGLVGMGLLYMASKHRRMAEVALYQISRPGFMRPDLSNECREAYTMSAALSFGMAMLGRGSAASSPADIAILSRLRVLIHGEGSKTFQNESAKPTFDVNLTSPAATLALGMMYLKTERQSIADILTIPDTITALNHIQPNFLLVRVLARNLIMWNKIKPNRFWLLGQVPSAIMKIMESRQPGEAIDDAIELAYYHITGGAVFALALKYAGTADLEAYQIINDLYGFFKKMASQNSHAFSHRIKKAAMKDSLSIVTLAMGIVMAGTGELNCLKRLRLAHGMFNQPTRYGTNMATHMSLGLLFLGGGRYTLGNSDAAIACMIAAFFPHFPALASDSRGYLPALRHLWVLATEPRCLVARDVDTKEVVYLPMKITVKNEDESTSAVQLIAPTLIPAADRLIAIKIESPRYWPYLLDIANNRRHLAGLLRSQTIFVKRRTMFLSYLEDPKGSRSLFVRSGMSTGDAAMLDFPQLTDTTAHPASDLQHYINSHANDISFIAFADRFCRHDGDTEEEKLFNAYCHSALLDCIIQDKPQTLASYLALYRARKLSSKSRYFPLVQQDLVRTEEFYSTLWERRFSGRSENILRPSLLRANAVKGALLSMDEKLHAISQKAEFRQALRAYVMNDCGNVALRNSPQYPNVEQDLAWYLQRHAAPYAPYYSAIREVAEEIVAEISQKPPPYGIFGTDEMGRLQQSTRLLVHASIANLVRSFGTWSIDSFNDVLDIWQTAN